MLSKPEILTLPEYQVLPRKLRQYVINRTIWQMTHAEACRLCRLTNRQRVADDLRVQTAIDAVLAEKRPPALAAASAQEDIHAAADALEAAIRAAGLSLEGMTLEQIVEFRKGMRCANPAV
jgi:hypothetical protein